MKNEKCNSIHDRIKYLRTILNIRQNEMALRLKIKQGSLSDIERKRIKTVTDRVINDVCREFSVNEIWLRTGEGEIFIEPSTFSLDEYAAIKNLTDLEIKIIKNYMDLSPNTREEILSKFKKLFEK